MKILLFIIILFGLTYIGFSWSKKHKEKLMFYKELSQFLNLITNEIKFNKNSLKIIIEKNYINNCSPFSVCLKSYFIDDLGYSNQSILTIEENNLISSFFDSLGKANSEVELLKINNFKESIKNGFDKAQHDFDKYGQLGYKLGFIIGLLICIVLI